MARLMRRTGDLDQARSYARQALAVHEEIGDRRGAADTLDSISRIHDQAGEHEQARHHSLGALDIQTAIGDEWGRGLTLLQLGRVHLALSRRDTAREYFAQAVTACGRTGNREGAAEAQQCLTSTTDAAPHVTGPYLTAPGVTR
jgi:tetratricopeptide (TPR) repeat protein